jgi:alpha-glucosidase
MRFWLDLGVDGFRVDAVSFMAKDPTFRDEPINPDYKEGQGMRYGALQHPYNHGWPQLFAYLSEMANVLKEEKYLARPRFMVTEAYPDTLSPVEEYLEFYEGVDPTVAAPFNFEGLSLPWQAEDWRKFLKHFHATLDNFSPLCVSSYAFGNHDQHRIVSRLGEPAARSAAVLLLTLPGMVFVYNGDELGMKNGDIPPDMVQDPGARGGSGRDPERTPLQWNPSKNAGFTSADTTWLPVNDNYKTHNVQTQSDDPDSFLSLYRKLGEIRNKSDALRHGHFKVLNTENDDVLGFTRTAEGETYTVLVNFSAKTRKLPAKLVGKGKLVVSSHPVTKLKAKKSDAISLQPNEAVIFASKP